MGRTLSTKCLPNYARCNGEEAAFGCAHGRSMEIRRKSNQGVRLSDRRLKCQQSPYIVASRGSLFRHILRNESSILDTRSLSKSRSDAGYESARADRVSWGTRYLSEYSPSVSKWKRNLEELELLGIYKGVGDTKEEWIKFWRLLFLVNWLYNYVNYINLRGNGLKLHEISFFKVVHSFLWVFMSFPSWRTNENCTGTSKPT